MLAQKSGLWYIFNNSIVPRRYLMTLSQFLDIKDKFELQTYAKPLGDDIKKCSSFYGSPRKHPYEQNRVVLVADPFSEHPFYYEFNLKDIVSAEEQPALSNLSGESVSMVRLWVKRNSVGLQCTPFIVGRI